MKEDVNKVRRDLYEKCRFYMEDEIDDMLFPQESQLTDEQIHRIWADLFTRLSSKGSRRVRDLIIGQAQTLSFVKKDMGDLYHSYSKRLRERALYYRNGELNSADVEDIILDVFAYHVPWIYLKTLLLQEPPLHEYVRPVLRERLLTQAKLRLMLFESTEFQETFPEYTCLAIAGELEEGCEDRISILQRLFESERSIKLVEVARHALGTVWEKIEKAYPSKPSIPFQSIQAKHLFQKIFLAPSFNWNAYLSSIMISKCRESISRRPRFIDVCESDIEDHTSHPLLPSGIVEQLDAVTELIDTGRPSFYRALEVIALFEYTRIQEWLEDKMGDSFELTPKQYEMYLRHKLVLIKLMMKGFKKGQIADQLGLNNDQVSYSCKHFGRIALTIERKHIDNEISKKKREAEGNKDEEAMVFWEGVRCLLACLAGKQIWSKDKLLQKLRHDVNGFTEQHLNKGMKWLVDELSRRWLGFPLTDYNG